MENLQNFHVLKVTYLGATNTNGSRVKIHSERFKASKIVPYNYNFSNSCDIAQNVLQKSGFQLIGKAEGKDCYYIISTTFESPKTIKI